MTIVIVVIVVIDIDVDDVVVVVVMDVCNLCMYLLCTQQSSIIVNSSIYDSWPSHTYMVSCCHHPRCQTYNRMKAIAE